MKFLSIFRIPSLAIWFTGMATFWGVMYLGVFEIDGETFYMRDYINRFLREAGDSLALIIPALLVTVLMAFAITTLKWSCETCMDWAEKKAGKSFPTFRGILTASVFYTPAILSSIPLFISGIFCIRHYKLDTLNSNNFFYGILCLAAFNVNYFFKRSQQRIQNAYRKTSVLYGRSLGLEEKTIFRYYVLPGVIRDHLTILRELLPHIMVESIVIEYTFSYNALLRSAVQALLYQNWHYFVMLLWAFVLFVTAFDILCRWLESFFPVD